MRTAEPITSPYVLTGTAKTKVSSVVLLRREDAYYCDKPKKKPKGFTHLIAPARLNVPQKIWFTFTIRVSQGRITGMVNGKEIASARIPSGTQGMPGFLVNQLKDCNVKIRNIKIKFLYPTKKQLEEFKKHPLFNWLKYKETKKK